MKKYVFLLSFVCVSFFGLAQVQIGNDINGIAINDSLGWSVATSGNGETVVVGAPNSLVNGDSSGQIKVYQFNGSSWIQLGNTLDAYAESDNAGRSVDITDDGSTIVIGIQYSAVFEPNAGSVQVFEFNGTDWIQKGTTLNGSDDNHEFGAHVQISNDGNRIAVGAPYFDSETNGFDTGALKVYDFDGSQWNLSFEVEGDSENDVFGMSIDMSGDGNHVVAGAWINEDNTTRLGYAKVFTFDGSVWSQSGNTIIAEDVSIFFGASSAISDDGSRVAVGSWGNTENGNFSGEVEVYERNGNSWETLGQDLQGEAGFERFGWSIDLSGNGEVLAVGAPQDNYMKLFRFINNQWTQVGNTLSGVNSNDEFGWAVDLTTDGTKLIVGDPSNDNNNSFAGFAQIYDVTDVLSVRDFEKQQLRLFPNPSNSTLTVRSNNSIQTLSVLDINGRLLKQFSELDAKENTIDVSHLDAGIYFLNIKSDIENETIKFVKN